ncbi:MAG TPA: AMP-binding protein [Acidimicrobiales bacterium]
MNRPILRAGDWIRLSAERFPDRRAIVFHDGSARTYAEINSRVNRLASALTRHGVAKGDRVAILALDGGGYLETILATMKLGAVYVPINYKLAPNEVHTLVARAEAKVILIDDRYAETAMGLKGAIDGLGLVVSFDGSSADIAYEDLLATGDDVEPDVAVDDSDIIGLAFTSGTTGLPKGVLQSQGMLKAMIAARQVQYDVRDDDFRYGASPMFHIAGQVMLLSHLTRGIPSLVLPKFDTDTVVRWLGSGEITSCFMVPTMISSVLAHPQVAEGDYSNLRTIIYGSAPMTPTLLRRAIERFGCDFINSFGAGTEAGLQAMLDQADHRAAIAGKEHLLGSIGKPATGVDLRIVDDDGNDVPTGVVGNIVTRSDSVMSGYLEMPEETAAAFRDGWFWGGDLAYRDEEGYLYLSGRSKDMIIRGGENIYPVEIETVLSAHPAVRECAVVGKPDEHWGEVVVAFVRTVDDADISADELRAHCRASLAPHKVPVDYRRLDEMPTNPSGKILKTSLRVLLAEHDLVAQA